MKLKIFQIDAFTDTIFSGNPAAICPLDTWLEDDTLQKIAAENNLSETAFFVKCDGYYELRWLTPQTEVNLCGHATLAAAWVLHNEYSEAQSPIRFMTKSGELRVIKNGNDFILDFPLQPPISCSPPEKLLSALGVKRAKVLAAEDYLVVLENEQTVRHLDPDFAGLKGLPLRGVIVTAPGDTVDFVSRWFGPNVGVDEDPVTGSSHTTLAPYWSNVLDKQELFAKQISERTGKLYCKIIEDRVLIKGSAVKYLEGSIFLD